ncbi:PAS domain S-box protein [Methanobacterium paludis]|uniref:histidine kinase n=1 Tax=Methanobacterium paludis (strain DSM 25820 / JCM 18151 / SWAN1) TaxID=868131 RepID=F6D727_METPW|nr:PAS domain S-box protein [Methanobacterium paludis]AEG18394.1 signal transduction histidine kinase [Methanobacterium paludis]
MNKTRHDLEEEIIQLKKKIEDLENVNNQLIDQSSEGMRIMDTNYNILETPESTVKSGTDKYPIKPASNARIKTENIIKGHQTGIVEKFSDKREKIEELKKSESMFRLLADSCPDVIYRISIPEGRYEYVSPSSTVNCGRSPEEFYKTPLLIKEILHPDWKEEFTKKFSEMITKKSVSYIEYQIIHKSGEVVWVSQSDVVIRDENGNPVAFQGIARNVTEKKRAEEIKARFESIVEHSNDAIISKNLDGTITSWNHAAEKIYGYSKEEMLGKSNKNLIPKGHDPEISSFLDIIHDENYDTLRVRKDGKIINVSMTLSPIRNSRGKITGISIISRDITQQKKAERELKASEKRYKLLVENVPVGILHLDRNGDVIDVNPKLMDIVGSKSETYTRLINVLEFPETVVSGFSNEFRECLETGRVIKGKRSYTSAWGKESHLQYHITPLLDSENNVTSIIGTCEDITERKKVEEALLESEEKFREVFNNVSDAVFLCKLENCLPKKFIEVNDVACQKLGYTREELLKMSCKDIDDPQMEDKLPLMADKLYKNGKVSFETFQITKNGSTIPVEINAHIFKLDGMDVSVSVARDITERKKGEKLVKKSLKEKELLLMEIHHRVKNNLMVISSLLNMQSRQIKDKEVLSLLKDSQSRARSMALIHEKLYSSNLKQINFGEYIQDFTEELFKTYSTNPNVTLKMDVEDRMLDINTSIPLGLIVNELISNSLKYAFASEDKGTVTVKFHKKNDTYTLTVGDDGVGIPDNIDCLNTESLGMKLVTSLTEQLDGELKIDTTKGTCFNISFRETEFI